MSDWKIGYPAGLKDVANEAAGKDLYKNWGLSSISLSSIDVLRTCGTLNTNDSTSCDPTVAPTVDSLNGGTIAFKNGDEKGNFYKITDVDTASIIIDGTLGNVAGDYFEAVTGESTYTFQSGHSPEMFNAKVQVNGDRKRMPFFREGFDVQYGRVPDSIIVRAKLGSFAEVVKLFTLLANPISYEGNHAIVNKLEAAPLILQDETGEQYLVHVNDAKVIEQGGKQKTPQVAMTFYEYVTPLLRGF